MCTTISQELKGEGLNRDSGKDQQTDARSDLDDMYSQKQSLQKQVESVRNSLYHVRITVFLIINMSWVSKIHTYNDSCSVWLFIAEQKAL